jgi:hypothetical protein
MLVPFFSPETADAFGRCRKKERRSATTRPTVPSPHFTQAVDERSPPQQQTVHGRLVLGRSKIDRHALLPSEPSHRPSASPLSLLLTANTVEAEYGKFYGPGSSEKGGCKHGQERTQATVYYFNVAGPIRAAVSQRTPAPGEPTAMRSRRTNCRQKSWALTFALISCIADPLLNPDPSPQKSLKFLNVATPSASLPPTTAVPRNFSRFHLSGTASCPGRRVLAEQYTYRNSAPLPFPPGQHEVAEDPGRRLFGVCPIRRIRRLLRRSAPTCRTCTARIASFPDQAPQMVVAQMQSD